MKHIFYFFTFLPILWELMNLTSIKKVHQFVKSFKNNEGEKTFTQSTFSFFMVGYIVWTIIGLITFQWFVFLLFLIYSLIPKVNIYHRWIDSLISVFILIFIILNAYHFHIDVWQLILNSFNQ